IYSRGSLSEQIPRRCAPRNDNTLDHELRRRRHALFPFGERRPRRGEARDGHSERGARDVIEPGLVKEPDRCRIPAVLAADSDLELRIRLAPALGRDRHELADARLIEARARILPPYARIAIRR